MTRRILSVREMVCLGVALGLGLCTSCDYSRQRLDELPSARGRLADLPSREVAKSVPRTGPSQPGDASRDSSEKAAILTSSIELIQGAALQPGGDNFRLATLKLNQYFEGTAVSEYQLDSPARTYLETQLDPSIVRLLQQSEWNAREDTRHLEDCMLYQSIAGRVAGTGDDLARVRRLFDWIVRQVQLVPAGSLNSRQLPQVIARPYDVLLRGLATEAEGFWAERSWLFMELCRQLGIDVGLLTYTRGNTVEPCFPSLDPYSILTNRLLRASTTNKQAITWICAALVDGHAYLFDARIGLPIPGPDGQGVATLEEALADPAILERMDLPSQSPYFTSLASLLASPTKIGVLLDSSPGFFAPKMRLLQRELTGKNRTILYCDAALERDHFASVLGPWCGEVKLWAIPMSVINQLFTRPQFTESTKQTLLLFRPEFPLVFARIKQLRGELREAVEAYVSFRLIENLTQIDSKDKIIRKEIKDALDVYATNYLALAQLELNNPDQARKMLQRLVEMVPSGGLIPANPLQKCYMFGWGAHANLGRIYESQGDFRSAIEHYGQFDPTMQHHGNLLRARELVWQDPWAPAPDSAAKAARAMAPK